MRKKDALTKASLPSMEYPKPAEKQHAQGYTDHGKLFIRVTAAIIDVKLIRDAIGGNGGFKDLLEVTGIVVIEQFTANQKPGMVINNHDASGGTVRFSGTPEPGYGETGERNRQNAGQIPWRRKRRNPSGQCVSEKNHQRPPDCPECQAIPACGISIGKATYKTGSVGFHIFHRAVRW